VLPAPGETCAAVKIDLPYFDVLLERLESGHPALSTGFGRFVHWGYWGDGDRVDDSMTSFAHAAERMSQRVCAAARVSDGQRILDVGCGWGGTIASLNEQLSHVSLTGLNIDPRQIERARRRVRAKKGNSVTFVEGDACEMPLADSSFDVVIALECAFHFPDRRRFLSESRRVLRPGGRLVVADFVPAPAVVPLLPAQKLLFGAYGRHVLGPADVTYSVERYRDAARAEGLLLSEEQDITRNTLPTYPILRQVAAEMGSYGGTARFGVTALEWVSKLRLLRYVILGFDAEEAAAEAELSLMAGE
jgi:ubiquinone/menaquinone biosynthesis C-methylase UbiE